MSDESTGEEGAVEETAPVAEAEGSAPAEGGADKTGAPAGKDGLALTKAQVRELQAADMDAMVSMKVDGKTVKMSVKDALKQAELGAGAQRRMQEAAQTRKEMQRLLEDEEEYYKRKGMTADEAAEKRLVSKYERLSMTPEQKKAYETEQQLKQYQEKDNQTRQGMLSEMRALLGEVPEGLDKLPSEQLHQELQRAKHVYQEQMQAVEKEFVDAWKSTGLPKSPIFGQWTASLMHASQVQKNAGQREDSLQASEAASIVKENFTQAVKEITGQMGPEALSQLLGPEIMKALREFDVQRVTVKTAPSFGQQKSPGHKPASQAPKNNKTVDENGWRAIFENIK
jgi:hypothetical protein